MEPNIVKGFLRVEGDYGYIVAGVCFGVLEDGKNFSDIG